MTATSSLIRISRRLSDAIDPLSFSSPVEVVYNPLRYARKSHELYLSRFARAPKRVLLVGMNPGPFGMAQTGIPFGDPGVVRDWMGIHAAVRPPAHTHPKRPVLGFDSTRSEVSGTRLWGWAKERFGTATAFFEEWMVVNFCPLMFLEGTGRNRTPEKLTKQERQPLFDACDAALGATIEALRPSFLVGVGKFAERRCATLGNRFGKVGGVLHPSPANPAANRGWASTVDAQLDALGVGIPK